MKKTTAKKLAITAAIFTAAFNMNACAYGAPEEDIEDYEADSSVSETSKQDVEAELTDLEIDEMEAVDEAISNLMNSDEYKSLDTEEERREAAIALINTLAESGTEEYPYPLIDKKSVSTEGDVISFSYKCGVLGGVMTEPFDPMMN